MKRPKHLNSFFIISLQVKNLERDYNREEKDKTVTTSKQLIPTKNIIVHNYLMRLFCMLWEVFAKLFDKTHTNNYLNFAFILK